MNKLFDITGKVVVITGGTGILGKAIAKYLALEGAKVVILGRRAEAGKAIVDDIKAAGGEAMFLVTDVMKQEVLEQNLADIVAAYGRVDSLLNACKKKNRNYRMRKRGCNDRVYTNNAFQLYRTRIG